MFEKVRHKAFRLAENIATERNFTIFIILTLVLIPLGELATNIHGESFVSQPVIVAFAGWAGLIMAVSFFWVNLKNKEKFYPSDIFLVTLLVFALISYVFSANGEATVFGYNYDEWLIHYIAYFSLMFAATNIREIKFKKYILAAFVAVTIINIIPSFLQSFGLWPQGCYYDMLRHYEQKLSYGLTQHCNFYAGIGTMFTACCTMIFLFTKNKTTRNLFFVISALAFYCVLCTGTRISLAGSICFFLFMIVYEFIMYKKSGDRKRFNSHFCRIGITAVVFGILLFLVMGVMGKFNGEMNSTLKELEGIKGTHGFDRFGNGRGYIWRIGLESVPDFWATGIGLDNYRYAFEYRPDAATLHFTQGKGHNEYIHILVTEGVFAITNYLMLLFYAFFTGIKSSIKCCKKDVGNSSVTWIFLVMFIAYVSQACFNSSVVNTTPYFWVVLGMVMTKNFQRPLGCRKRRKAVKNLPETAGTE